MKLLKTLRLTYILLVVVTLAGAMRLLTNNPQFETDILSLLPRIHRDPVAEKALRSQAQAVSAKVMVVVRSPEARSAESTASRVADEMRASGLFERVDARISSDDLKPLLDMFMSHPFQLVGSGVTGGDGTTLLERAKERAFAPDGVQWLHTVTTDPLLLFPVYLKPLLSGGGRFTVANGFIHVDTPESRNVLITAQVRGAAYERHIQKNVANFLEKLSATPPTSLLASGIILFANDSAQRTQTEVSVISAVTMVAVTALLALVFRSMWVVLVIAGCNASSFIASLYATNTITQEWHGHAIHLITLGFGSCLLGVAVDYAIHFFVAHRTTSSGSTQHTVRRISSGIALGFITTVIGFLGIAFSPFPGLQQLALFCIIGLTFAIASVCLIVPLVAGAPRLDTRLQRLAELCTRISSPLCTRITVAAVILLAIIGLPRLQTIDDIRTLNTPSPHVLQTQKEIAQLVGFADGGTVIVVEGATEEDVLQKEEHLKVRLDSLIKERKLESFRAMSDLVPSRKRQREHYQSYAAALKSSPEALSHYAAELHLPDAASSLLRSISLNEPQNFLVPADCLQSGACRTVEHLWHPDQSGPSVSTISLDGFRGDPLTLVEGIPHVRVVNHAQAISHALRLYRTSATTTTLTFYGLVLALLVARYGLRHSWRVAAPALCGGIAALSSIGLAGVPLNVFSVFALLVLLGVAIDYGIFFAEDTEASHATGLAVLISTVTTILSFGALAFSSTPALQSFGVVLSVGVFFAALLAPLAQHRAARR